MRTSLDNLVYAKLTKDDATGVTWDTPVAVPGTINASVKVNTNQGTLYADNQAWETATSLGDIDLELEHADIPTSVEADLLGHLIDLNGALVKGSDDEAPYVALGFKGKYKYYWLYKGQFALVDEENKTKTDGVEFQTKKLKAKFIPLQNNGEWQAVADSRDAATATAISTWFTAPYVKSV